jgi:hypothetical protein
VRKKDSGEDDLKRVQEFLDFAKISRGGGGLEQNFDGFSVAYDGYWTRYRIASDLLRCQFAEGSSKLPGCARYCWKLLVFRRKPEQVAECVSLLFPLLKSGEIKSFKHNADTALDPSRENYVLVIYTWGIEERDRLKAKLYSTGLTDISYRRGCKMFEKQFGHWKQWFREEE